MNGIKEGDVVQLKSGGPNMTVSKIHQNTKGAAVATCDWFEGKKPMYGTFPVTSLKPGEQ